MALARSLQDKLDAKRIVIMDSAIGTEISRRGVTIHSKLSWSANANITSLGFDWLTGSLKMQVKDLTARNPLAG